MIKIPSPLLTAEEAAAYLRLTPETAKNPARSMRELARRHKIKAVRFGHSPRFRREDLDRFVEKCRW